MDKKYLPIGTVCTVKGNTKKVMITGFLKTSYNGNLKLYDYIGCVYPEGNLISDKQLAFNHEDIENVDFMGYTSELHNNFNNILNSNSISNSESNNVVSNNASSQFIFDENGVVIFDNTVKKTEEQNPPIESSIKNPFNLEYKPESDLKINKNSESFRFDENGVVIEDNTAIDLDSKIDSIYVFDENGFVIEDKSMQVEKNEETTTGNYQFDENGIVISDNNIKPIEMLKEDNEKLELPKNQYQFDENGIVIAEDK